MAKKEKWIEVSLAEILESLETGRRPKGGVQNIFEGVPSIGAEHLNDKGGFNFTKIKYVPIDFARSMKKGKIRSSDIIVVKDGATTGKTSFVDHKFPFENAVTNEHVFICRVKEPIEKKYVFYYLFSPQGKEAILSDFRGAAQGGISTNFPSLVRIPLAPLEKQKLISKKLDEIFGHLDLLNTRLDRIPELIKAFKEKVLTYAITGKLTEEWRKKNKNEQLAYAFDLNKYAEAFEIPSSWRFVKLNKICSSFQYGSSQKSDSTGKVAVLRMGNIQNGEIDWSDLKYTSDEKEIEKYSLKQNDVLFNRTNSPELVGKTAIYRGEQPAIFAGYLIRINYLPQLDPEYLNICLNTNYFKAWCLSVKSDGVSQSNINANKLGTFEIPFCPLKEQKEIVRRVKDLFSIVNDIEHSNIKLDKIIRALPNSVLSNAFNGELLKL